MNKREYIQANKDWLEAKAKEEGVKALPKGIYYNVLAEGNAQSVKPSVRSIVTAHYTVTKDDADSLHHKAERFIAETGCKKSVSLTMVTVSGIAHTGYWSEIHNSITSEDLFKA